VTSFALAEIAFPAISYLLHALLLYSGYQHDRRISVHNQQEHAEWSNEVVNSVSAHAHSGTALVGVLHSHELPRISSNKASRFLLSLIRLIGSLPWFHQLYTLSAQFFK